MYHIQHTGFIVDHCVLRHVSFDILDHLDLVGYTDLYYQLDRGGTGRYEKISLKSFLRSLNVCDLSPNRNLVTEGSKGSVHMFGPDSPIIEKLVGVNDYCQDCGDNEVLFQALTAMNERTDFQQWFHDRIKNTVIFCTEPDIHKAAQELGETTLIEPAGLRYVRLSIDELKKLFI